MKYYQSRIDRLKGTRLEDVYKKAQLVYTNIKKHTKRQPYIRSAYFKKSKIFFNYFWVHDKQKSRKQRTDRLLYFPCAIDLIKNSKLEPTVKINPNKPSEILYRFAGKTRDNKVFYIQIKEVKRSQRKYLMSIFPEK